LGDFEVTTSNKLCVIKALIKDFLNQGMRIFFFAPELMDDPYLQSELRLIGLRKRKKSPWASGLIDLSLSKEELFKRLNRRWKRMLRKAEDLGVKVRHEVPTALRIEKILCSYRKLQKRNNFAGVSEKMIIALSDQHSSDWQFNCYIAEITNEDGAIEEVGNRLVIRHGKSSIDFLVTSTDKGRAVEANSILYWHAILGAKNSGCNYFDIGGLGQNTPRGIADFKGGLNSDSYQLIGEWWGIHMPAVKNRLNFFWD
jgi:lipid II:glycine glycyltransferase (peptidoglycan interpeptide bridge formation enzyme)